MCRSCGDEVQLIEPFSLRIFVADGDPGGPRIVEQSNRLGRALMFLPSLLSSAKVPPDLAETDV